MPRAKNWLGAIRRTFGKSSYKTVAVLDHNNLIHDSPMADVLASTRVIDSFENENDNLRKLREPTLEDSAAIKIQAYFRGHLARRAFRALRSLVKLQAVVRGVCMRRQTRIAIQCMQTIMHLQVKVRARQLFGRSGDVQILASAELDNTRMKLVTSSQ